MNRTKKEKKINTMAYLSMLALLMTICLNQIAGLMNSAIFGAIGIILTIGVGVIIFYLGYSLGWESKRIQIVDMDSQEEVQE